MIFGLDINKIFFWNILNFIEKFQKEINHLQIIFFYIFMRGNFFKLIFENICLCILLIFNKKEKKKKLIEPYEF